jgi:hypothetical protein
MLLFFFSLCHEGLRCQDRNLMKRMQYQQILVPTDDMGGLATEGEFEKFIVLRVATVGHNISDHHSLRLPHQSREELQPFFFIDIFVETGTAEDVIQFCHGGGRNEDRAVL